LIPAKQQKVDQSMIRGGTLLSHSIGFCLSTDICRSVRLLLYTRFRPAAGTALATVHGVMQQTIKHTQVIAQPCQHWYLVEENREGKLVDAGFYAKVERNKTACLELQQPMLVASAAAVASMATVLRRLSGLSRHRNVHLLDSDLIYHAVASVNCRRHDVS
jgi:hypothetical protein